MLPANSKIEVVVTREPPDGEDIRAAAAVLSSDEWRRADRFIVERPRRSFIARRAQLRRLLGARLGIAAASVRLSSNMHGKPRLAAPFDKSGLRFNVSHSDDLTIYAFAPHIEVGVDVEAIRVVNDADRIAALAFSPRECETYERLNIRDKLIGFLNCWTRKEAFVKATGFGLCHSLNSFDVSLAAHEPARILRVGTIEGNAGWLMHSFSPAPGFIAAVAARAAP